MKIILIVICTFFFSVSGFSQAIDKPTKNASATTEQKVSMNETKKNEIRKQIRKRRKERRAEMSKAKKSIGKRIKRESARKKE